MKRKKVGKPIKPSRKIEAVYNQQLQGLVADITSVTTSMLEPMLRRFESEYTQDSYSTELNAAIRSMSATARGITGLAQAIAAEWANGLDDQHKALFYKNVNSALGINLENIINEGDLRSIVNTKIEENIALIQSIPDEYFKKLSVIVNQQTSSKKSAKSIIDQIRDLTNVTKKRAKLIARDQTQKLNAAITRQRQTALGIVEYRWQTSDDERVRESHKRNNGKIFNWNSPPKETGHPGEDIQCRCVAIPIINVDNLIQEP